MIKESISPKETVAFLNSLLEIDRIAISDVFSDRKSCNTKLADHPTVQVGVRKSEYNTSKDNYIVGMLGLLNGMFGKRDNDGFGAITMEVNNDGVIERFVLTEEERGKDED